MRVVFMGTPDFAVPALAALIDAGHDVVCVYSQPPRPAGRGHKERPSPVHAFAAERGIEVRTPASLKSADVQADFAALGADVGVVAAYGLILPKAILDAMVATDYKSMVGPVKWTGQPVKNVTKTPLVAGQWQRKGDKFDLVITTNKTAPEIPTGGTLQMLS